MPRPPLLLIALVAAVALMAAPPAGGQDGHGRAAAVLAVHEAQERLRDEIAALRSLKAAQQLLLDWNAIRARGGAAPAGLAPELCREEGMRKWCEALPATFGRRGDAQ